MKHDFRKTPTGDHADRFRAWLESETLDGLKRCRGDTERLKGAVFLFVNRAYEARLPEEEVGAMFGKCFVRSGQPKDAESSAFDLLDQFAQLAKSAHEDSGHSADS